MPKSQTLTIELTEDQRDVLDKALCSWYGDRHRHGHVPNCVTRNSYDIMRKLMQLRYTHPLLLKE